MAKKEKKIKFPSELRMDLISGDWVILARNRAKKPDEFKNPRSKKKGRCPFCDLKEQNIPVFVSANGKTIPRYKDVPKNWTVAVVPNKYPALIPHFRLDERTEGGLYKKMNAVGFHEVVIARDHKKQLSQLPTKRVKEVIDAYQARYLDMKDKRFVNYISIFHNHGPNSGASIAHTHSQIITTVLLDADFKNALDGAKKYYQKNKECLYCHMTKYELKAKERIVFENKRFVALCPYASKMPFQTIITPKKHLPYFEEITEEEKTDLAEALKAVLHKINKGLRNPSYNFYLHTAPCDEKNHDYYHWHWTVLPKIQEWAGFEIGTKLEIITVAPEQAAQYLRKQ